MPRHTARPLSRLDIYINMMSAPLCTLFLVAATGGILRAPSFAGAVTGVPAAATRHTTADAAPMKNATLVAFLTEIADWTMTVGVGENMLHNRSIFPTNDSIFVNGNLARVLFAAAKITGNSSYTAEGLRWCDTFVNLQLPITTSTGKPAGYWDTGYREVFIADTGTAVAALAVGYHMATPGSARRTKYISAMQKYKLFVTEGCITAPTNPDVGTTVCPPSGEGWVHTNGVNKGALGDGWCESRMHGRQSHADLLQRFRQKVWDLQSQTKRC